MKNLSPLDQAILLVRREMRSGLHGFGVFLACLFLGVFAISAIGSFSASARSGLLADAGALLGGDLEIRLAQRELTSEQRSFLKERGALSEVMQMRTMAAAHQGSRRALVEVKAVDDLYPLYGHLSIRPVLGLKEAFSRIGNAYGALAEEAFLQRFELQVGEVVEVGDSLFRISGVLTAEPDRTFRAFTLGPRLMMSREGLAATGLVQPGSLVTYGYRLRLPDREQTDALKEELQAAFPEAGWRLTTWRQAAPRVRFFLDRMSTNLTLIGLSALLVGGLGVSGAVRGYLSGKIMHIAAMKCLGATGRVIFIAYLLQILILGSIGTVAGLLAGAALPYLAAWTIGDVLPFPLSPGIHPKVLVTAALFGLIIALLFSLKELGVARRIPPGLLFRSYTDSGRSSPGKAIWAAIALATLLLCSLAVLTSGDRRLALWFILGAGVCFLLFRLLAALVIRMTRRLPRPADPRLRLGLTNIHRRGSPAASVLFSLGLGLTALVMIALVQANLTDLVEETVPDQAPAFFLLDIQPGQVAALEQTLRALPAPPRVERYPTLRGRITRINGIPVEKATIAPEVRWAVRGDRFLSYAQDPPQGTTLSAGQWWPSAYNGAPQVSLTADVARGFGVEVGDSLTVNVLGRDITARIANLRIVDWSTLKLNFAVLFAPGVLENAPQTHIATIYVPQPFEETVFRSVTGKFPNISAIGTREVLGNVSRTLSRIGGAFKAMATVVLLTGFLVLAGAVSADQHRRIHDAVIFKVCGATRRDIVTAFAVEFVILGLAAGAIAALAGSLAAFGILQGFMDTSFTLHPLVVLGTLAAGIGLTLLLGLMGTWKALGQKPAVYLRGE